MSEPLTSNSMSRVRHGRLFYGTGTYDADAHDYVLASDYDIEQRKVKNLLSALEAKQAKIDALMLEFCPGEMSVEQLVEWAKSQQPSHAAPPADLDPEPSRADKLRAALKPAGVKVNVLGKADEPPAAPELAQLMTELLDWSSDAEDDERNNNGTSIVSSKGLRELCFRAHAALQRPSVPQKTVLPSAKQGRQRLGEIPADASTACESREAGEAAGGSTVPPPKPAHEREPPHCSSCSCGMPTPPPAASQVEEVLCAGVVVSSPHDRRITLRFETDEQFRAAEVLIGIADCQVIDTAVTKPDDFATWRDRTAAEVANELPAGETEATPVECPKSPTQFHVTKIGGQVCVYCGPESEEGPL